MRSLRDCGVERDRRFNRLDSRITLVAAKDSVDRIENRDVHDGHGATGASGSELLAKGANFTGRDRGVIESAGVDGDLVPAMNRIERVFRGLICASGLRAAEARSEEIAETGCARVIAQRQAKRQKDCGG